MKNLIANNTDFLTSEAASRKTSDSKTFGALIIYFASKTKRTTLFTKTILFVFLSLFALGGQTKAASFAVNTATVDASDANIGNGVCDVDLATVGSQCTLRAAIQESNAVVGADTITISNAANTINLTIADLYITGSVSITGNGARTTTIQRAPGAPNFRVFYIQAGNSTVNITGVTIANGNLGPKDGSAAGILNNSGSCILNLNGVTIRNNTAIDIGGGILNLGTLNMTNSTVSNNTGQQGGGINNNNGTVNISNSTVSDNTATNNGVAGTLGVGGGIVNYDAMTLNNVTISNNTATSRGGGFYNSTLQALNIRNTIIAGNTVAAATSDFDDPDFGGTAAVSQGNNLIGIAENSDGFINGANGDKVGTFAAPVNAQLGALQNNGGQTDTRALLGASPAIDAGNNCVVTATCPAANALALATDQRGAGFSRQLDGDKNGTATVDIGAFEAIAAMTTAANVTVSGRVRTALGRGVKNVVVKIVLPDGEVRTTVSGDAGYYQFTDVPAGETYIFSVSAKHYQFAQSARVQAIDDETENIDFIADAVRKSVAP